MIVRIDPKSVRLGMFVHGFDGPWLHHPFWRTKFVIETHEQLARVRDSGVEAVLVEEQRNDPLPARVLPPPPRSSSTATITNLSIAPRVPEGRVLRLVGQGGDVPVLPPTPREAAVIAREAAKRSIGQSKKAVRAMFDAARAGRGFDTKQARRVVDRITTSVARDPGVYLDLVRLKSKHEYTYMHSVAVCALMVNLAREMGIDAAEWQDIGVAGLFHDLGKMAVPVAILDKPERLTDEEYATIKRHPERGERLLNGAGEVPPIAVDVCLHHHEKMDGTGYPHGLSGDALSVYARMGAVCDVYDAVTSARAYKQPWPVDEALTRMRGWTGHFDTDVLDAFERSLGLAGETPGRRATM